MLAPGRLLSREKNIVDALDRYADERKELMVVSTHELTMIVEDYYLKFGRRRDLLEKIERTRNEFLIGEVRNGRSLRPGGRRATVEKYVPPQIDSPGTRVHEYATSSGNRFVGICDVCGWKSTEQFHAGEARTRLKTHVKSVRHRNPVQMRMDIAAATNVS